MRVSMPVGKSTTMIILKDVLYAPKMGVTFISIGKIDAAGYAALFHKSQLQIFLPMKGRKLLAQIPMVNGLYRVEHQGEAHLAVAVDLEVVSIESVRGQVMLGLRPACPILMNLVLWTILTLFSY